MRILVAHNRYQQAGGEDVVFESERDLLRAHGHEVACLERHNREIEGRGGALRAAVSAIWSPSGARAVRELIRSHRPDVAHFCNVFPLISPSAYYACREAGVPVVQTVQNYRLVCPGGYLYRAGRPCEDCLGKAVPWPGVVHGCYRGSRLASAAVGAMTASHRAIGTWSRMVDAFVAATEFSRQKLVEGGLPAEKIVVKPNFLPDPPAPAAGPRDFFLFVGRLSPEKGVHALIEAWRALPGVPLKIAGGGPLEGEVRAAAREMPAIEALGFLPIPQVLGLMQRARALVFPSAWYEGFPTTIVQSFACATPVMASRLGSMAEIVEDGRSGLLFEPGSAAELVERVRRLWAQPELAAELGRGARAQFDSRYTADENHRQLMRIYERVMRPSAGGTPR